MRSTIGIFLCGLGSLNAANNLPDLLVGLAPQDLRPNVFSLACATVGFIAPQNLLTAVGFALCDAQVCIAGVVVVLFLLVEASYICNIVIRNNTNIFL